ncbi:patatin-like phospholipase family protein [Polaromonas sp.]|uniref:patatin-like phospholipase family protein n=1 Tax=Polaromonas sp. TaxID=1869339 RepID=UPI003BABD9E6
MKEPTKSDSIEIALALSGGGARAMAFHLGVLRYLAEQGLLERICRVSTVSGGSLLVGLMFHQCDMRWPSSEKFKEQVYDPLRAEMCSRSIAWATICQLFLPWNWVHLLSRANLVAKVLQGWGIKQCLEDLPCRPEWSINGTTAENGRRFRFKRDSIGDWQFGYAQGGKFPLAKAMAVSAAFPGLIGPLSIKTKGFAWKKRKVWDVSAPEEPVTLLFKHLHLYDGGVYDNLGLEPYYDVGRQQSKIKDITIYVSDAGAPLAIDKASFISLFRAKRLADIMSEQSRTLRVRSFFQYLERSPVAGAYTYIATKIQGGNEAQAELARSFPTNLSRMKPEQFDAIAGHGYAVAQDVERQYGLISRLKL